jgi:hypothetical protein
MRVPPKKSLRREDVQGMVTLPPLKTTPATQISFYSSMRSPEHKAGLSNNFTTSITLSAFAQAGHKTKERNQAWLPFG